ncbi:SH3 domain-containing protein [Sphingomonas lacunae]|uniref:SH3 domain-containing protein n=1 Tax=Sphingomonas lacunae TaxID=2698828 RepID=A0A6M4AVL4_9SPHN|nr:SH3 domain-containing protein [Sphingomonas lacunae]QJQ32352.1 SH3 domain-containing protein [Sphingomonas lacunae]
MNDSTNCSERPTNTPKPAERVRFHLSGHSRPYDPTRQAIRPDLADLAEAEHHFAPHYAKPADWLASADTILRASADSDAEERQRLKAGDRFALLDITGGWAWGYAVDGHVVGYVEAAELSPAGRDRA